MGCHGRMILEMFEYFGLLSRVKVWLRVEFNGNLQCDKCNEHCKGLAWGSFTSIVKNM
jgi:hypothetical protein